MSLPLPFNVTPTLPKQQEASADSAETLKVSTSVSSSVPEALGREHRESPEGPEAHKDASRMVRACPSPSPLDSSMVAQVITNSDSVASKGVLSQASGEDYVLTQSSIDKKGHQFLAKGKMTSKLGPDGDMGDKLFFLSAQSN
ncbi:hypothetical protein NDU88_007361 [Pleurodeles waltl]|uniref:Uncharacterized protein n=1 Tax=Pleurodeles waltl TaxID=8319 RepID=A0AAV7TZL7_PLEWA|nr:hypothetical protein NDU88_007361 [Pleurodeles waltl]